MRARTRPAGRDAEQLAAIVRLAVEVLVQDQKGIRFIDPTGKLMKPVGV